MIRTFDCQVYLPLSFFGLLARGEVGPSDRDGGFRVLTDPLQGFLRGDFPPRRLKERVGELYYHISIWAQSRREPQWIKVPAGQLVS